MPFSNNDRAALAQQAGVHLAHGVQIANRQMALDAQTVPVTASNAGIPAFLANYIDPAVIEALVAPMKAAEVFGEAKKGDWTTATAMFALVEATGQVASYDDYSNNGNAGVNVNFPFRQSFHYQTVTRYGEKELETAGLAQIDLANRLDMASVLTLNKFQNKTYLFGVSGLQNYGILNDPNLSAAISPTAAWSTLDGAGVYTDIVKLFSKLMTQANGLIDMSTPMTLVMSPTASVNLTKTNQYNVNVMDQLAKNFPNLKVEVIPEYKTDAGEVLQLIVDNLDGQDTVSCAFTEKLRQHAVIREMSAFKQKKSQGTWGAIVYRPFLIAQMLGV